MTPPGTTLGAVRTGSTWAIIVAVAIGLWAVDQFLAGVESAEVKNSAQRSYRTGVELLAKGMAGKAVDSLRDAHALERQNPEYELQLIEALTAGGKEPEAEPLLTEILQRAPNDGRANLIAARVALRQGNMDEAEAYYHRAIYGDWSGDTAAHRVSARLELIDLLAGKNRKQELLAELVSLEAESPARAGHPETAGGTVPCGRRSGTGGKRVCRAEPKESNGYRRIRGTGRVGAGTRPVCRRARCFPAGVLSASDG